jgi:hypothetical protein
MHAINTIVVLIVGVIRMPDHKKCLSGKRNFALTGGEGETVILVPT